jgi:hypothetical protein
MATTEDANNGFPTISYLYGIFGWKSINDQVTDLPDGK